MARATIGDSEFALKIAGEYISAIANIDISRVDNVKGSGVHKRLMRSYARNQGTQSSMATIYADIVNHYTESLSVDTVTSYVNALKKLYVIEDVLAWNLIFVQKHQSAHLIPVTLLILPSLLPR